MRVVCAPDSFKGSLSAVETAGAMARGLRRRRPGIEVDPCPIADGGEGTLEALLGARKGRVRTLVVPGPLGEMVNARFATFDAGRRAVVELAQASGLTLVPPAARNPTLATTAGTGRLIRAAIDDGATEIVVALGGSATVDGGLGLAQAVGARCFDARDRLLDEPLTGRQLFEVARVERPALAATIVAACDVTNPLCGPDGAAAVYGPQKGATAAQVSALDAGLAHLAGVAGLDPATPGYGAAGGAGFGLVAWLGARLERGIDVVLETVGFERRCAGADLVVTGEGCLDEQSLRGKAVLGVARAAARCGVPTAAIVGDIGPGAATCVDPRRPDRLARCISLTERFGKDRALHETAALMETVVGELIEG